MDDWKKDRITEEKHGDLKRKIAEVLREIMERYGSEGDQP